MRFILTLFWTSLLILMLYYVAGSMVGVAFDFQAAITLGVAATILVLIVPAILPNDDQQESH